MDKPAGRWKPALGYEEFYDVSEAGEVWSHRAKRLMRGGFDGVKGRGYRSIWLSGKGEPEKRHVHRIVLDAFVGPKPPGHGWETNHRDGDKKNNSLSNLEYVTSSQNKLHAHAIGLPRKPTSQRGSAHTFAKLSESQVSEIRALRKEGWTYRQLGELCGVTMQAARAAILGQTWRHVDG